MSRTRSLLITAVGVSVGLVSTVASAAVYPYSEQFPNTTGNNIAVSTAGWKAYSGSTAVDKSNTVDNSPAPRVGISNLLGTPHTPQGGYLFTAHRENAAHIFAAYVEFTGLGYASTMDWKMANSASDGYTGGNSQAAEDLIVRVLVRDHISGQWYASTEDFSTSADAGTATQLQSGNVANSFAFSNIASNWLNVTLIPGTALSVSGASPSSNLSGIYDRVGFIIQHPASNNTIDTVVRIDAVNIVPEPASIGALLGSGLFLLRRRR